MSTESRSPAGQQGRSRRASSSGSLNPTAATPHTGAGTSTPASPPGGPLVEGAIPVDVDNQSPFGTIGWFTASDEGCTVSFGIEQQGYFLDRDLANYNALFSLLLACKYNGSRVSFTYRSPLLSPHTADPDPPLHILSIVTI